MEDTSSHSPGILGSQDVWRNVLKVHKQERNIIVLNLSAVLEYAAIQVLKESPRPEGCTR